jgi:hypothetical protein
MAAGGLKTGTEQYCEILVDVILMHTCKVLYNVLVTLNHIESITNDIANLDHWHSRAWRLSSFSDRGRFLNGCQ